MDFRILGPLEVYDGDRPLPLGGARQRALLGMLLLHANEVVSSDRLIDELWVGEGREEASNALRVAVSRLRKALQRDRAAGRDGELLVTRPPGYELRLAPGELDLERFQDLVAEGRSALAAGDSAGAAARLSEALGLWRGAPLADLTYESFCQGEIGRLEELRRAALEDRIEADLALGRHADLVAELQELVAEQPLRERPRAQLMLALYRAGRQAEALEVYQAARGALTEELGIEPGRELQELQRAVLAQEPTLDLVAARAAKPEPGRGVFVGRDAELGELLSGLEDALAGRGALFLLVGEPGIGKSRLAEELVRHARARGARVLVGRCWEAGGAPAYWPWVQSLRDYVSERDAETLRGELGTGAAELAQLLPELRELLPDLPEPPALDAETARFRLFDAAAGFLRRAAAERPIVLVLDDLHAADEPSLLLLRFVARGLGDSRVLVVGSYRDVDPTLRDPLVSALAELTREPVTRRIALSGLAEHDVGKYISLTAGLAPDPATVATIHAQTEGNAFFVGEVTRLLIAEGALERRSPAATGIPQGVRDVVGRRIRRLSDGCRRTLTTACVLGREFALDAVGRMTEHEPHQVIDLLDEALEARVIGEAPGPPGRLRFSHALVRDTLYDDLTPGRRLRLHAQAGEVLEALYAENREPYLAELAYHFAEAAPMGDLGKAVEYARRAGERAAALLAFEEAARLYRLALGLVDAEDPATRGQRCDLLLALGDVQARSGEMPAARETFLHAADIAREAGSSAQLARAALGYGGRLLFTRGASAPHVVPLLEQAGEALGNEESALRVRVLARLASVLRDQAAREPREALSVQALESARRLGDRATLEYALASRLSAMLAPDAFEERLQLASELAQATDKERASEGHTHRIVVRLALGDLPGVREDVAAADRLASELRQPTQLWFVASLGATLAIFEGRLADAEVQIQRAHALGERAQRYEMLTFLYLQQFGLRREQGRLAEIADELERAPAQFPTRPVFRCMVAALDAELGRLDSAKGVLRELAGHAFDFAAVPVNNDLLLSATLLAEVAAATGDVRSAEGLYGVLAPYADLTVDTLELSTGSVARYLGLLAAVLGRDDEAVRRLEEAFEANKRMGARPWLAHAQCDLARLLLARAHSGDGERAATLLAEARATVAALGLSALDRQLRSLEPAPSARGS